MPPAADYALALHAGSGLLLDESRRVCPCVLLPLRASLALVGRAGGGGDDEDVDMGGDYLQGVEIIDSSYGMIEQSISSTGHYSLGTFTPSSCFHLLESYRAKKDCIFFLVLYSLLVTHLDVAKAGILLHLCMQYDWCPK